MACPRRLPPYAGGTAKARTLVAPRFEITKSCARQQDRPSCAARPRGCPTRCSRLLSLHLGLSPSHRSPSPERWSPARPLAARIGAARALNAAAVVYGGSFLLYAFTTPGWGLAWYVAGGLGAGFGIILINVYAVSFRQAVTPRRLLGRVTSVSTTLIRGMAPLGSLAGGILAEVTSMRTTLYVVGAGLVLSTAILLASPLRKLRNLPE
jgi:MFS family permease